MNTDALKRRLAGKLSLPSLPAVVGELQQRLRDPSVGMKDLAATVATDPPLTARVLRIVNSAYYSLSVPVLDIAHAVAILGLDTVQSLVLQVGVMDVFQHLQRHPEFDPRELWTHSVRTARLTVALPRRLTQALPTEDLYVCGLLHDIGKFVLFEHLHDEFLECVRAETPERHLAQVEADVLGFSHADVGALVCERWGLPEHAVRAIGAHHDAVEETTPQLVALIALADLVTHRAQPGRTAHADPPLPRKLVKRLELSDDELEGLCAFALDLREDVRAA
ncbi:MAG: HDOD domain-containing protein [Planctomycetes bacterium]|nr:HDOD domain-containing protein [Planctomycetota bacterium]